MAAKAARISLARTGSDEELRKAVERLVAVLGPQHPQTIKYAAVLHG
jgi:hypothetical protein